MGYLDRINFVPKGADATAGNVNTAPRELQGNINHIKELFDAASLGEALFKRDVTLDPTVKVGQPVYWDEDSNSFKLAFAASAVSEQGTLIPAASAEVAGIVYYKTNATLGDLLALGTAEVDLSEAVDSLSAGRYYLSSTQPGKLVKARPGAAVSVLFAYGDGTVTVLPVTRDFLEDHIHYQFDLVCAPAGTHLVPSAPPETHAISNPDPNLAGWLPADHAIFAGKAPAGAAFGYNLSQHTALLSVWPPVPVTAAGLTWDKGEEHVGGTQVPLGENGLVVLDRYGIWWMSNCYGDVPWPTDYLSSVSHSESSAILECPRTEQMSLRLDFIKMSFATDHTAVVSLESLSPALVVQCDGAAAKTGALTIDLLLDLLVSETLVDGYVVLKGFDGTTQTFTQGAVVEGLIAGANVTLTSETTRRLIEGDTSSPLVYQNIVEVAADVDPAGKELTPVLVRIDDMVERYDGSIMYLSLMPDFTTSLRGQINIPSTGLAASPKVKLRVTFFAQLTGSLPTVTLSAVNIPRPTGTPALPSGDTTYTLDVGGVGSVTAGDYFEVESEAIDVTAGSTLFFTISRAGSDGYSGEVGIIKLVAVIQA